MKSALLGIFLIICAAAQTPAEPPPLVRVIRSFSNRIDNSAYANARATITVLGMSSVSGPSETWWLEAHDSFASIEDLDRALNNVIPGAGSQPEVSSDDVLPQSRAWIALYRHGWSFRPEEAVKLLPKARYFQVSVYRNRSGNRSAFAELVRSRKAGLDSINLDRPDIAYEVISGAPSGTYLLLAPLTSLRSLDQGLSDRLAAADRAADPDARKSATAEDIAREHLLFRVDPRASHVSEDFASADPDFWRGNPRPNTP